MELVTPFVYVDCITFNHAPYIVDAMNGFCMQETTFPYVCALIDDASTDGEQDVIREYLHEHFDLGDNNCFRNEETDDYRLIFAQHKTNKNCYFAAIFLKYNHYSTGKSKLEYVSEWVKSSKFVAFCEGDDYWTDSNKLQRQVNILDSHREYGLVYTQANIFEQVHEQVVGVWGRQTELQDILFGKSAIPTLSVCLRSDIYLEYLKSQIAAPKWVLGDVPLWLYVIYYSKVYFIPQVMGTYRLLIESASHSEDFDKRVNFIHGAFMCRQYYANIYCGKSIARKVAKIRIQNLLSLSFQYDKYLKYSVLKDLVFNRIFDVKWWMLALFSKCKLGRNIVNKKRNLSSKTSWQV